MSALFIASSDHRVTDKEGEHAHFSHIDVISIGEKAVMSKVASH